MWCLGTRRPFCVCSLSVLAYWQGQKGIPARASHAGDRVSEQDANWHLETITREEAAKTTTLNPYASAYRSIMQNSSHMLQRIAVSCKSETSMVSHAPCDRQGGNESSPLRAIKPVQPRNQPTSPTLCTYTIYALYTLYIRYIYLYIIYIYISWLYGYGYRLQESTHTQPDWFGVGYAG